MSFKTTLAMLALLGGLVAFWFFYSAEAPSTPDAERDQARLVARFQPGDHAFISITRPATPTVSAVVMSRASAKEKWKLEQPAGGEADQTEADGILSTIEVLESKRKIESPDDRKLGLDPARLRLEIGQGDKAVTILFGDDDHTGKNVFARVAGRKEAHLVPSYAFTRLDRKPSDFRDKSLFTVDRWQVQRISIAAPGEAGGAKPLVSFKKDGDRWALDAPDSDLADRQKVEDLLGAAQGTKAREFPFESPDGAALAASGLKPPRFVVTLDGGETGGGAQSLEIGGQVPDEKTAYYAKRSDRPDIVKIDKALVEALSLDPEPWRSKTLYPFVRDRATAIDIRKPGAPEALARLERNDSPGAADNRWRFVAPEAAGADDVAVEELLRALQDLAIVATPSRKVVDPENFGLSDKQALLVTIETPKEKHAARLGKASMRPDGYYASREGRPAAYEVLFPRAPVVRHAFAALRDKALLSRSGADVSRLDVKKANARARPYVRMPDGWTTPERTADAATLDRLATELAGLRAERIILPPEDLGTLGLKLPWLEATVAFQTEGEPPARIELGRAAPDGDGFHARLVRGSGAPVYFVLRKDVVDALDKESIVPVPVPVPGSEPAPPTGSAGTPK